MSETECISGRNTKTVKFATQVTFGLITVATSIVFMAVGGSTSVWLPILTGTVGYFLPNPSFPTQVNNEN